MSKESLIKETKSLLEAAQKEVLNQINSETSFFSRLFSSNVESLRTAQSCIAKALNHIDGFGKEGDDLSAKLQSHLSEKDIKIKELEAQLVKSQEEKELVDEKLKFTQKHLEKAEAELNTDTKPEEVIQETSVEEKSVANDELEIKFKDLEALKVDLEERYQGSQEELREAQTVAVELSQRLKKLKVELVAD